MKVSSEKSSLTVGALVDSWQHRTVRPNPEYQRGRAWNQKQQQLLIDSVLRGYPLPRLYFYMDRARDPLGNEAVSLQIIDGLQRIMAFGEFMSDSWRLLDPKKDQSLFPRAIRELPCPWAGRLFSELSEGTRVNFADTSLPVVLIEQFDAPEEVRDLFIRLQAGTALTRQQVRDAWPGNIGPYVERLAGKLRRQPQFDLFGRVDRRGGSARDDDDEFDDPFVDGRQTCSQLLRLFLDKRRGNVIGPVYARALDELYHSETDFDLRGGAAADFERLLGYAQVVITDHAAITAGGRKAKVTKLQLFSVFLSLFELDKNQNLRIGRELGKLANAFWDSKWWNREDAPRGGKVTSSTAIQSHFDWFQHVVLPAAGLTSLDPVRSFTDTQKGELRAKAGGVCAICGKALTVGEEDFDHVIPWILGGRTTVDNGRALHRACNRSLGATGQPAADS
jgi:hypothetical protein